ncbi:hypothetical protein Tco_0204569 [Tanacetum coccineum]
MIGETSGYEFFWTRNGGREDDPKKIWTWEEEEEEMDADEQWDGPEWILPYQGADPLYPPPPASDSEAEDEAEAEAEAEAKVAPIPPPVPTNPEPETATIGTGRLTPLKRLFTDTQVWTGSSSSSAAVGHNPKDLTPSHIRSDLDALHRRVWHIEEDDVRADNKRLKMIHSYALPEALLAPPPRLQYQEPPYALPEALLAPATHIDPRDPYVATRDAATAPATDNDDSPTPKETSPSEPQGSPPRDSLVTADVEAERERQVNARGQKDNANEVGGQGGAPAARECTFSGFMKCNPTVFHGHEGAVELSS